MPLTKEQFDSLRQRGLTTEQIIKFEQGGKPQPVKKEPGFLRSVISDPIKTLLVKPADRAAEAVGRTGLLGNKIKTGYEQQSDAGESRTFGGIEVEPQKAFGQGGGEQIIGDTAKTASYLYTGGGLPAIAGQGAKGQVLRTALNTAKTGAVGGGAYSFGDAIQNAENQPSDIAYQTLFGTLTGGAVGGALGVGGAILGKGAQAVKPLTTEEGALTNLSDRYSKFLGMTGKQTKLEEKFGKDTPQFLANEFRGELPLKVSGGNRDLGEAIDVARNKYSAEAQAFNTVLRNSGEYGSVDVATARAKALVKEQFSGTDLEKALNRIEAESNAFKQQYADTAVLDDTGKQLFPIADIDEMKKYQWSRERAAFGSPDANLNNDTNFLLGKGFQEEIETKVTQAPIKNWNKRLGDFASSLRILENRNGLKVTNNFLNRLTGRVVGGITGGAISGPLGSIPATITGDWVAQQLSNPEVNTFFIKKALQRLPTAERNTIVREAEQILNAIQEQRASTLALPSPRYIPMGPETPKPSGIIRPNGEIAGPGNYRNLSAKIPPTTIPTTTQNTNAIIPETLPSEINPVNNALDELYNHQSILEETIANNPAKQLAKFANKNGELPEVIGAGGKFGKKGDDIVNELGFADSEQARSAYQDYKKQQGRLRELTQYIKDIKSGKISPQEGKAKIATILAGAGITTGGVVAANSSNKTEYVADKPKKESTAEYKLGTENENLRKEIAYRESRGSTTPYTAVNKNDDGTSDYGKYQVNEQTLKTYAKKYIGKDITPEEFMADPAAQEKFFDGWVKRMKELGVKNPKTFLALWHKGWSDISTARIKELLNNKDVLAYINTK